ncbi:serine protease [Rhizopus stolonifer]|uniref:Serine protease n=1 Tax=Rhizopus stolonifer TaxID=4846 RepID=A0A367JJK5_RHIST|nr:serine protease [Rhizopus stolonifer]
MMIRSALVFFAVSCISAASAASINNLDGALSATNGNGNFIIQLEKSTCINDFVPKLIDNAFELTAQASGHDLVKRGNKIVRRGTEEDHVHVFDAYDLGGSFKAIGVKFENKEIIKSLLEKFDGEILKIVPDMDIQFDLPTLKLAGNKRSRFSRRAGPKAKRKGNLDVNSLGKGCANGDNKAVAMKRAVNATEPVATTEAIVSQAGAEWNLIRVSQRNRNYNSPYYYDSSAGSSAYVYVVDDGMNVNHNEFAGRARWGFTAYTGITRFGTGHGTHVAGTIGGTTYGVAKKANLIAVQVLDDTGSGSISSIISGLQWVTNQASGQKGKAIINMSLGVDTDGSNDPTLTTFNNAVSAVVNAGIPIFAAAGNSAKATCQFLPAGNSKVYAVAASTKTDGLASFSNYGSCTQVIAPGENIKSSYISSSSSTAVLSGTSMASPHVAGVAALLVGQLGNPSPTTLYNAITSYSTKNAISGVKGTPNNLLFNNAA